MLHKQHEAGATVRMAPLGTKDATLRARSEPGLSGAARAAGRGAVGRRSRRGSARREDRKHYGPEIAIILEGITSVDTRLRKTLLRRGLHSRVIGRQGWVALPVTLRE